MFVMESWFVDTSLPSIQCRSLYYEKAIPCYIGDMSSWICCYYWSFQRVNVPHSVYQMHWHCSQCSRVYCDNNTATNLAKHPSNHRNPKHFPIQYHFVGHLISLTFLLDGVDTKENVANMIVETEGLPLLKPLLVLVQYIWCLHSFFGWFFCCVPTILFGRIICLIFRILFIGELTLVHKFVFGFDIFTLFIIFFAIHRWKFWILSHYFVFSPTKFS